MLKHRCLTLTTLGKRRKRQPAPDHATPSSESYKGPRNRPQVNSTQARTGAPSAKALGKRRQAPENDTSPSPKRAKTLVRLSPISIEGGRMGGEPMEIDCSSPPRRGLPSGSLPDATGPPLPGPEPIPPQDIAFRLRMTVVKTYLKNIPKFAMPSRFEAPIFTNHYLFRRCDDGIGNFVCRGDRWLYGERLGKAPDSRHVLYAHYEAYPHAPSNPGENGLLIGGRNLRQEGPLRDDPPRFDWKDNEEKGACQCTATLLLSKGDTRQFLYMGEYQITFSTQTSGPQWTIQSLSVGGSSPLSI